MNVPDSLPLSSVPELESFDYGGRRIVFAALFGSHNYNLNTPVSDHDYKVFVMPSFDDLYEGHSMQNQWVGEEVDVMAYDVRRLPEFLWKSNPAFVEILYSHRVVVAEGFEGFVESLWDIRDATVSMNLSYLWNGFNGTHLGKMANLVKGTSGTMDLVSEFGYDTKQAMHALRMIRMGVRFAENGFTGMGEVLWNEGSEKNLLMGVRRGEFTLEEFRDLVSRNYEAFKAVRPLYESRDADRITRFKVESLVKGVVAEGLGIRKDV